MNTYSTRDLEARWAIYFKSIAFMLPAILLWVGSCVFVLPKLKEICDASGTIVPKPMLTALAFSELFKNHVIVLSVFFFGALAVLERRSRWWLRNRRLFLWTAAFALNFAVLILITTMFVVAVIAGANLLHVK